MNYICTLIILVSMIDYNCVRVEHVMTRKPLMYTNNDLWWTRYNALADRLSLYVGILCTCVDLQYVKSQL